jgi:hypothetical protein
MIIYPPELQLHDGLARVSARFTAAGKDDVLWFEVDRKYADFLVTDRVDAFLVGLLPLAMRLGEGIELRHPVSQRVFFNVDQNLTSMINFAYPDYNVVPITANGFAEPIRKEKWATATGLSCGVDSLFTVIMNSGPNVPSGYKLTHVIFTNVGSHGRTDVPGGIEMFQGRLRNSQGCAEELGLELVLIDSNMEQVLSGMTDYDRTLTFRTAAAVMVLEKLFSRYLHSSGVTYQRLRMRRKGKDSAAYEPITLPALCTDSLEFMLFGANYSRIDKTAVVADFEPSYRRLNVCGVQVHNCSRCSKCMRTMLTLEVLGKLDRYSELFDIGRYRGDRYRWMAYVKATRKRWNSHWYLVELMKKSGFHLPYSFYPYYAGYLLMFKGVTLGRTIAGFAYEQLEKVPRLQRSRLMGPLRFVLFRFDKIAHYST